MGGFGTLTAHNSALVSAEQVARGLQVTGVQPLSQVRSQQKRLCRSATGGTTEATVAFCSPAVASASRWPWRAHTASAPTTSTLVSRRRERGCPVGSAVAWPAPLQGCSPVPAWYLQQHQANFNLGVT